MSSGSDRFITVFSPEGRLWQVEYAFKAVKQAEVTAIAARTKDCLVVTSQKKVSDKLIDPSTVTHMYKITDHVGACLIGLQHDCHFVALTLRYEAAQFKMKNGFEILPSVLSSYLSERHQVFSQYSGYRPLAVSAIIFGFDVHHDEPRLYKIDPSGFLSAYKAVATGVKEVDAMVTLEKSYKEFETLDDTIQFTISTLQNAAGQDFEAKDIEVAVITRDNTKYRLLDAETVDHHLNVVSEKDFK